jgi:hypothetical protein
VLTLSFVKGLGQGAQMQRNDCAVMMIFVFVKGVGQGAQMQRKDCLVLILSYRRELFLSEALMSYHPI